MRRDLLNTRAPITDKKAGFRSLGEAWADTTTARTLFAAAAGGKRHKSLGCSLAKPGTFA